MIAGNLAWALVALVVLGALTTALAGQLSPARIAAAAATMLLKFVIVWAAGGQAGAPERLHRGAAPLRSATRCGAAVVAAEPSPRSPHMGLLLLPPLWRQPGNGGAAADLRPAAIVLPAAGGCDVRDRSGTSWSCSPIGDSISRAMRYVIIGR